MPDQTPAIARLLKLLDGIIVEMDKFLQEYDPGADGLFDLPGLDDADETAACLADLGLGPAGARLRFGKYALIHKTMDVHLCNLAQNMPAEEVERFVGCFGSFPAPGATPEEHEQQQRDRRDRVAGMVIFMRDFVRKLRDDVAELGRQRVDDEEERSAPMTRTAMVRLIRGGADPRPQQLQAFFERHDLRSAGGQLYTLRLNDMDANTRRKLEKAR